MEDNRGRSMEWIKTSERLPPLCTPVIVHDGLLSGIGIYKGFMKSGAGMWDWWHEPMAPLHWMPLPSPPEEA